MSRQLFPKAYGYTIATGAGSLAMAVFDALKQAKQSDDYYPEALLAISIMPSVLEAFINEISSICSAFRQTKDEIDNRYSPPKNLQERSCIEENRYKSLEDIQADTRSNPHDRLKSLGSIMQVSFAQQDNINLLVKLRNDIIHFKSGVIPIVSRGNLIAYDQPYPNCVNNLKKIQYRNKPIVWNEDVSAGEATYEETEWLLRVTTKSMAFWVLEIVIKTISEIFQCFPKSELKEFIWDKYKVIMNLEQSLFEYHFQDLLQHIDFKN